MSTELSDERQILRDQIAFGGIKTTRRTTRRLPQYAHVAAYTQHQQKLRTGRQRVQDKQQVAEDTSLATWSLYYERRAELLAQWAKEDRQDATAHRRRVKRARKDQARFETKTALWGPRK